VLPPTAIGAGTSIGIGIGPRVLVLGDHDRAPAAILDLVRRAGLVEFGLGGGAVHEDVAFAPRQRRPDDARVDHPARA